MSVELHPYDGVERRFRDGDTGEMLERGRALVRQILQHEVAPGTRWDLSFYSGGIGVMDHLYIRLPCSRTEADAIIGGLGFITPECTHEEIVWLVACHDEWSQEAVAEFIRASKSAFQPEADVVYFEPSSGVNSWAVLYYADAALSYIAFDQG
jgi:hypothetical protein